MRVEKTQKVKVLKRPTWLNLSKPLELNDLCKTSGNEGGERSERTSARATSRRTHTHTHS